MVAFPGAALDTSPVPEMCIRDSTDSVRFRKFLNACASLTAEQVNYKTLAEAAEISQPTAKEWLRILQGSGIVYLLQPFANNELKRLTKTPKLYFCDTGLCAYLSMWLTRDLSLIHI